MRVRLRLRETEGGRRAWAAWIALGLGLVASLGTSACVVEARESRPDVVVILNDTTRADQLGPYGGSKAASTPFIDRLAEQSLVFDNAWTASTHTAPSTASVFTGLLPPRHGVEKNFLAQATSRRDEEQSVEEYLHDVKLVGLPDSVETLTEHLSRAGYQTLGIGANINFSESLGFSRGFDIFNQNMYVDAEEMAQKLYELSGELDPDRPHFTYMHFMDPHAPYHMRKPWCPHETKKECSPKCRYRSEISYVDQQLGEIFDHMGWLDDDTIVVLVTDHGEEFREHGSIMHRYSVHTELSKAGLIIHLPGRPAERTQVPASHADILPTILQLLDLPAPRTTDGVALLPTLDEESSYDRAVVTIRADPSLEKRLWALTWHNWRLLEEWPEGTSQLFNIQADPKERHNLAEKNPEMLDRLSAKLAEIRDKMEPIPHSNVAVHLSDTALRELERLGYAGEF